MNETLLTLTEGDLREIAAAIRAKRLAAPFTAASLQRVVTAALAEPVASELQDLNGVGFGPEPLAVMLELLASDRRRRPAIEDVIDVVTTGPEASGAVNRDTSVVVRELFANTRSSVLVAGYAVYQGQHVFRALADRMQEYPELDVRMFLDIQRGPGDTSAAGELVQRFAHRFKTHEWPEDRPLPEVFHYPRSLESEPRRRACLHAKCVAVDSEIAFVSSANFTEAAHERNIEVGLLIRSRSVAERVVRHFEGLVDRKEVVPIPLGSGS